LRHDHSVRITGGWCTQPPFREPPLRISLSGLSVLKFAEQTIKNPEQTLHNLLAGLDATSSATMGQDLRDVKASPDRDAAICNTGRTYELSLRFTPTVVGPFAHFTGASWELPTVQLAARGSYDFRRKLYA
jgi:hypothetical protein